MSPINRQWYSFEFKLSAVIKSITINKTQQIRVTIKWKLRPQVIVTDTLILIITNRAREVNNQFHQMKSINIDLNLGVRQVITGFQLLKFYIIIT